MANTVKILALRPFFGTYGKVVKGQVIEVSEAHARKYEQRGIAVSADFKAERPLKNKEETGNAPLLDKDEVGPAAVPLDEKQPPAGRTGGQTGKNQPWLSSEPAPAQVKSTSKKSKK